MGPYRGGVNGDKEVAGRDNLILQNTIRHIKYPADTVDVSECSCHVPKVIDKGQNSLTLVR